MNDSLKGKKLLVLAGAPEEISLVKRAQSYGVYVIVTDMYNDFAISPAKEIADEYWDISWSDIDALEAKCRIANVDGICAGYSEFTVENQIKLCERLNLPCYLTMEQLDITRDKKKFKETCRKYCVPVVKEYSDMESVDEYPVIVKPVDRAGSIGVSIATNFEELKTAYLYAMEMSVSKQVIIEKFMTGTKIDVYYEVFNGDIRLVATDDTIDAKNNGYDKVVQSAWLLPSKYQKLIVEKTDTSIRNMLSGIGIMDGYIFISGFVSNQEVVFFETGFRLGGEHIYEYLEKRGSINSLDLMIYHALTGNTENLLKRNNVNENLKCVNLNIYAHAGVVKQIHGIEEISKMEGCDLCIVWGRKGQICSDEHAILSKMAMFYFCSEDTYELENYCKKAYELLSVTGEECDDLIFDRIDTSVIHDWWEIS